MKADVAVLGAGPSGAALATWLARHGASVVMVDRDDPPTDKVGESLIPMCGPALQALGVDMSGFTEKFGATFTRDSQAVRFGFDEALGDSPHRAWHVRRSLFDQRVRDVAVQAGAHLLHARVQAVELPGVVQTSAGPLHAQWVVDAMGRGQLLAKQLGLRTVHPLLRNTAIGAWHTGVRTLDPEQQGDVTVCCFEGGWFWFVPLGDGVHSVGVVSTPEGPRGSGAFERALALCPAAHERLRYATALHPLRPTADFTTGASALSGPGWALAGDAASFLDPVFSTGLCLGLWAARPLADAIVGRGSFAAYETIVRDSVGALEPVVLSFYDGSFLDVAFGDPSRQHPTVRAALVSLLAGDVFDPAFTAPRRLGRRLQSLARMAARTSDS